MTNKLPTKTSFKTGDAHPRWKGGVSKNRKAYEKEYNRTHPSRKDYYRKLRAAAVEALGGRCARCGFDDVRALQIDHINGGGVQERKNRTYKGNFHKHVLQSFLKGENKFQLLCANHNWIKRFENDERNKK